MLNKDKLILSFSINVADLSRESAINTLRSAMNQYKNLLEDDGSIITLWLASDQTKVEAVNMQHLTDEQYEKMLAKSNKLSEFLENNNVL